MKQRHRYGAPPAAGLEPAPALRASRETLPLLQPGPPWLAVRPRQVATALLFGLGLQLLRPRRARANGGKVEVADRPIGPYRVTVTSSPNPLRVGTADLSVLVLEGVDQLVQDAAVTVSAYPTDGSSPARRYPATHALAANPRYYAANVQFPSAGRWQVAVEVRGPGGGGQVQFTTDISGALLGMTPFELGCLSVPALALLGLVVAELRELLKRRQHPGGGAPARDDRAEE